MTKPKKRDLSEQIGIQIQKLLRDVMADQPKNTPDAEKITLKDKLSVLDRALKLAAVQAKMDDPKWGQGFHDED